MDEELKALAAEQESDHEKLAASMQNLDEILEATAKELNQDFAAIDKELIALEQGLASDNEAFEKETAQDE